MKICIKSFFIGVITIVGLSLLTGAALDLDYTTQSIFRQIRDAILKVEKAVSKTASKTAFKTVSKENNIGKYQVAVNNEEVFKVNTITGKIDRVNTITGRIENLSPGSLLELLR